MLPFKRNKIKLSLIEDYVAIILAKNFFNNDFSRLPLEQNQFKIISSSKALSAFLLNEYDKTLERLKLNDLSLLILKKQLKENNKLFFKEKQQNFKELPKTLAKLDLKLQSLLTTLNKKQKALNITPFEIQQF